MAFDEKAYKEFLIAVQPEERPFRRTCLSGTRSPSRPADAEIAAQLKAVRAYWNKKMVGQTGLRPDGQVVQDGRTTSWPRSTGTSRPPRGGSAEQRERDHAARQQIEDLARPLKQDHGALGVVTAAAAGEGRGQHGPDHGPGGAGGQPGRPDGDTGGRCPCRTPAPLPAPVFGAAGHGRWATCERQSVPELIHPGVGAVPDRRGYECVGDRRQAAGHRGDRGGGQGGGQEHLAGQHGAGGRAAQAQGRLRQARRPARRDAVPPDGAGQGRLAGHRQGDAGEARRGSRATRPSIVALLRRAGQGSQGERPGPRCGPARERPAGRGQVAARARWPATRRWPGGRRQAVDAPGSGTGRPDGPGGGGAAAPDEALADTLLRTRQRISAEDAGRGSWPRSRSRRPRASCAPPATARRSRCSGSAARPRRVTGYVVRRTPGRPPAAPTDGEEVYQGPGTDVRGPRRSGRAPVSSTACSRWPATAGRPPARPPSR